MTSGAIGEFDSWNQYSEFSRYMMMYARHFLDVKNRRFLDAVVETSEKRRKSIEDGTVFWRAQLGCADENTPYLPDRMLPLAERAIEGRVNPKGIPCVY